MPGRAKTIDKSDEVVIERCLMCGYRRAKAPSSYYLCCRLPMRDERGLAI